MAEMTKKDNGPQLAARDPFHVMRELMRWDPFREMAPFSFGPALERGWNPSFDVRENKDGYVFKADLPGLKQEDISIQLIGNRLQISGKRDEEKETKEDTYYAFERSYGSFMRSFTLPDSSDLEHIKTDLSDGVLTVVVPKRAEAQAKTIPVSAGKKS